MDCADKIAELASTLVAQLQQRGLCFASAESCTGGAIAQAVTSVAGCSSVVRGAVVAYHNDVKTAVLGVDEAVIERVGAVSEEVVVAMVNGVSSLLAADCAVATSGIAGPGGGTPEKPVGTVWVAAKVCGRVSTRLLRLCDEGRGANIRNTVAEALEFVLSMLTEISGNAETANKQ